MTFLSSFVEVVSSDQGVSGVRIGHHRGELHAMCKTCSQTLGWTWTDKTAKRGGPGFWSCLKSEGGCGVAYGNPEGPNIASVIYVDSGAPFFRSGLKIESWVSAWLGVPESEISVTVK